ncbi:MAG: cytochrome c [Cytophagaceae bacterium]|nr:cytochrome c [Cytophagaceae bacterium]MBK9511594.1 cytochrome c [Cytophagaceae bacterium]MBK9934996.1 cytochrome c [Cytophagaceae bacterium]MBL0301436.1 cytochrome c [Cytophagaceae bacterium]MBL0324257.1 cytochrome c [Cytophagaceae bacterium]
MKNKILGLITLTLIIWGCGGAEKRAESPETSDSVLLKQEEVHGTEVKEIALSTPLDQAMVKEGQGIYDMKCGSCHKLTQERLVGPGWSGVTKKRKPEWIINMITNVDMMLESDPEAQKMLEECLIRMPNQNISEKEARGVLEFMRQNDGEK